MAKLSRVAPELPAHDLRKAVAFYEQKLGFQVATWMPNYAIVERDGVALHLFSEERADSSPVGLHIFTAQLEELFDEFRQRGARPSQEIVQKPWGNRDFRIKDESGNEIKFTEPLAEEHG
jgi:predicted enzyme related to lactoylglutathione lyase